MPKTPDRLNIDKKDRELYDIVSEESEIFKGKTRREQFLFAMAIGFKNKVRRPLETKEGFFLIKDLRPEDEALLNAVAIFVEGPEVLSNKEKVFKIAEEYAHAGIRILEGEIKDSPYGTFVKRFERDLFKLYAELDVGEHEESSIS